MNIHHFSAQDPLLKRSCAEKFLDQKKHLSITFRPGVISQRESLSNSDPIE